ncbi:nucleoside triphosphate pyrophosphohydrolase [Sphingomonas colocasiae]|uniref:Nucleoside triphosphate pyrophosphohydrolase n=1 Tax=Sphingomonas colocasiae TaxID=1848973 RepID=A0ABS7PQY0_9SPHN|nr:nucleoside triphosphate pyrophosphohydrolase [Sphingomonas colocasiae]MBY8823747.1 nucleoside triphosphate pyrophosphohydrolase [Sphingomonas colocasiae]
MNDIILSDAYERIDWADIQQLATRFGVKGASSLAIPRAWTPPFALISAALAASASVAHDWLDAPFVTKLREISGPRKQLLVRSSVVGESIWERGTFESHELEFDDDLSVFSSGLIDAISKVLASTGDRETGIMVHRHIRPTAQGEFGNLQRISKTRDHWEISIREADGLTLRQRLNSQRDQAAEPEARLAVKSGLARERLFGSVGAWLNNELLRGRSQRLNCEWITDNSAYYLVQIDEEDEDLWGANPFQVRVAPAARPEANSGAYFRLAEESALREWDKLEVLEQLWEPNALHKPTLFYAPLSALPKRLTKSAQKKLEDDFRALIGKAGIMVRTSVPAGAEKITNLPRSECLDPATAADWVIKNARELRRANPDKQFAFVAHRFVASRSSAWVRAEPQNPVVEINSLWGLPDALQYCPYDIWEVHVPTGHATDYPEYKSDMLISQPDGGWQYVRVKNELARSNSIVSAEAKDVALRSAHVAERLGRACHIMWFIGCVDVDGRAFNLPWYWTEAHEADHDPGRNPDRSSYRVFTVTDRETLGQFVAWQGARTRQALALRPTDLNLMRDNEFIEAVGAAAHAARVPIILSGSTLAHAFYQLRKIGCTIVTPTEKDHSRVRRATNLGKLVRDKIPGRIAERQEIQVARQISGNLRKGFLISKLIEEALEVREASSEAQKREELADLFEVFRAIAKAEGVSLDAVKRSADDKRRKAGGFEEGLILLQTGIAGSDRDVLADWERGIGEVLTDRSTEDSTEIPFSFFGFMEMDQPRSIYFEQLGMRLDIVLKTDRLELRLSPGPQQLGLPLT